MKNRSSGILGTNIERTSAVQVPDIVLDPELLVDFANCKYKVALRIEVPSCPIAHSEIDTIQGFQRVRLKERWCPTTNDGYEAFDGSLSSSAHFRALSISVFGNIKGFATMRRVIGGSSTETGLKDSLMLLSVCQTLRNKRCSSLDFLRSGNTSLKQYLGR